MKTVPSNFILLILEIKVEIIVVVKYRILKSHIRLFIAGGRSNLY